MLSSTDLDNIWNLAWHKKFKVKLGRFCQSQVWQVEYNKQRGISFNYISKYSSLQLKELSVERGPVFVCSLLLGGGERGVQFTQMIFVLISEAAAPSS